MITRRMRATVHDHREERRHTGVEGVPGELTKP
jgi:hypothetical protein